MGRHDSLRKLKKDRSDELDSDLLTHIRSLGLVVVEDYISWCASHGFSGRTDKHWRLRSKELSSANRASADSRLTRKKQELKNPAIIIERVLNGELKKGAENGKGGILLISGKPT